MRTHKLNGYVRICFLMLIAIITLIVFPLQAFAADYVPTTCEAYNRMIALREKYYEGYPWTNDDYYGWKGGIYSGGFGCAGFAFMLSDAAFGNLPAQKYDSINYRNLRVGDILRINGDTHSVVIMEKYDDFVILAEGNYNSSIHWGRILTKKKVLASDYYITRYPDNSKGYDAVHPVLNLPKQIKTISEMTFDGISAEVVIIHPECESIEANAFANCPALKDVYILFNNRYPSINSNAFNKSDHASIHYILTN